MFYVVDAANRVVEVDLDWDEFLLHNGGTAQSARDQVLGRALEGFMAGDSTRMFVRVALDAARLKGLTRVLPYRCDSPTERRHFEMIVSPAGAGHVRVDHRLLRADVRPTPGRPWVGRTTARWRCSQCLAVRQAGSPMWVGADRAAPGGPVAEDVCPDCARRLFA